MTPQEFETTVRDIVARAIAGQSTEDSMAELKSTWIDAKTAARHIAAHANAARRQEVIWIIGVDERAKKIQKLDNLERSDWLAQIRSSFDDERCPEVIYDRNYKFDDLTVAAFLFDTSEAPYVVKNPQGGQIGFEVPWRRGAEVRTAKRADLLRILVPIARLPVVEVRAADFSIAPRADGSGTHSLSFDLRLLIYPFSIERISIPGHRCKLAILKGNGEPLMDLKGCGFMNADNGFNYGAVLIVERAGSWDFRFGGRTNLLTLRELGFRAQLPIAEAGFEWVEVAGKLLKENDHNWKLVTTSS